MIKKPQVNITHLFIAFLVEDLKHFQFSERNILLLLSAKRRPASYDFIQAYLVNIL